jgi:deazaflavin-dependent oxidoreductase (nitroreductase family)
MPNILHQSVLSFSSSPVGAWLFSRLGHHVDRWTYELTGHRATFTTWIAGMPMVMVEVIGRKSGQRYLVPLVAIQRRENPEEFALVASNWGQEHYPAWYYNLLTKAEAQATLNGKTQRYSVHEAKGEEYQSWWQTASSFIPNYSAYKRSIGDRRRIPILVLKPAKE